MYLAAVELYIVCDILLCFVVAELVPWTATYLKNNKEGASPSVRSDLKPQVLTRMKGLLVNVVAWNRQLITEEILKDEAEDRLHDAILEKSAVFTDRSYGLKLFKVFIVPFFYLKLSPKDHQEIDILLAEIDIYELFAFKHCKGRRVKLALCEELDKRMQDLKSELQSFEGDEYDEKHKKKDVEALKRMESWNIFTDSDEITTFRGSCFGNGLQLHDERKLFHYYFLMEHTEKLFKPTLIPLSSNIS